MHAVHLNIRMSWPVENYIFKYTDSTTRTPDQSYRQLTRDRSIPICIILYVITKMTDFTTQLNKVTFDAQLIIHHYDYRISFNHFYRNRVELASPRSTASHI